MQNIVVHYVIRCSDITHFKLPETTLIAWLWIPKVPETLIFVSFPGSKMPETLKFADFGLQDGRNRGICDVPVLQDAPNHAICVVL